jgi:hypothetical protein
MVLFNLTRLSITAMSKLDLETGWTVERVAKELGVKPRTVYYFTQTGALHPQKCVRSGEVGAPVSLFDPGEVGAFLQKRVAAKTEIVPASDPGGCHASTICSGGP